MTDQESRQMLEAIERARRLGYRDGLTDGLRQARSEAAPIQKVDSGFRLPTTLRDLR